MESKEQEQKLDQWLDAALRQYGDVEPRAGLEGRVLARLRAEQEKPAPSWRTGWVLLAATTAAVLAFGAYFIGRPSGKSTVPAPIAKVMNPPVAVERSVPRARIAAPVGAGRPHDRRRDAGAAIPPKREQFPSPAPLSEQEKLLARYVSEYPREAALEARAQTELLKREETERQAQPSLSDSEQQP